MKSLRVHEHSEIVRGTDGGPLKPAVGLSGELEEETDYGTA